MPSRTVAAVLTMLCITPPAKKDEYLRCWRCETTLPQSPVMVLTEAPCPLRPGMMIVVFTVCGLPCAKALVSEAHKRGQMARILDCRESGDLLYHWKKFSIIYSAQSSPYACEGIVYPCPEVPE